MKDFTASLPGRVRPRRLRRSAALRDLIAETQVRAAQLIMPHFVMPVVAGEQPIPSMPGISRLGVDDLVRTAEADLRLGIKSLLLFGVPKDGAKDADGSSSRDPNGTVPTAIRALRAALGHDIVIFTDACLCAYTDHGHCGVLVNGEVDNDRSLGPIAENGARARGGRRGHGGAVGHDGWQGGGDPRRTRPAGTE